MKINLLQISLIISLIGILILLSISSILQPKQTNISKINIKQLNKNIQVSGEIIEIRTFEDSDFQIITIKDSTGEIKITSDTILDLTNNQNIIIIGKITEYQGELQIQANKILSHTS